MIIAAYAGAGKSTFASQVENAIDMVIMPYSRILPESGAEPEKEKGAPWLLTNPCYADRYIAAVLRAEKEYEYVIIPTNKWIIYRLHREYHRRIVVCCPTDECKDEYRRRFLKRGNSSNFIKIFIDQWEEILPDLREMEHVEHIPLESGEYLTDIKDKLDAKEMAVATEPVPDFLIEELEQEIRLCEKELVLFVSGRENDCIYRIPDISDPTERSFLYHVGKTLWELDLSHMIEEEWFFDLQDREYPPNFVGRDGLKAFLEGERRLRNKDNMRVRQ